MAEALKRQYDIIVLKTELLDVPRDISNVRFTLQCKVDGNLEDLTTWPGSTQQFGFKERLDSRLMLGTGPPTQLPNELLEGLKAFMQSETDGDRPLWVHLVKPYGVLRFVPWERLLGEALGVAILMLPDFIFPPPRESKAVLEVVLCGSAPLGHEEASVQNAMSLAVDRILEASVRRTRIHVFVDGEATEWLSDHWRASGRLGGPVLLHDNRLADKYVAEDISSRLLDRTGSIRSPWLLWMRDALRGRSIDVLHFVCHGYVSRERGALLFAQSPLERTDRYLAGPVGSAELQMFLTQVGAWSTVFTSLTDNYSEPGLRALADEIAQSRPGPLMMHSLREDPRGHALSDGYRFLYASEPVTAPVSKALFIYCQPYRTTDAERTRRRGAGDRVTTMLLDSVVRNAPQRDAAERADDTSIFDALFEVDENVAPMIASTERFAEQVQLRYQQLARDQLLPGDQGERELAIARETIDKLRDAVAEASQVAPAAPTAGGETAPVERDQVEEAGA